MTYSNKAFIKSLCRRNVWLRNVLVPEKTQSTLPTTTSFFAYGQASGTPFKTSCAHWLPVSLGLEWDTSDRWVPSEAFRFASGKYVVASKQFPEFASLCLTSQSAVSKYVNVPYEFLLEHSRNIQKAKFSYTKDKLWQLTWIIIIASNTQSLFIRNILHLEIFLDNCILNISTFLLESLTFHYSLHKQVITC